MIRVIKKYIFFYIKTKQKKIVSIFIFYFFLLEHKNLFLLINLRYNSYKFLINIYVLKMNGSRTERERRAIAATIFNC